ncbi:hypothetical protein [Arthrobacter woluwensis]|uniref:Uncharacterized protein n=1 Tax=Arthrobacter woluwensis TaxID=156980 RepID=A0A1H4I6Y9_9MICC|nr:hypothetical protein [Arthrobacter woluwensis]SEB29665.1 hypothetical protein SAMN04489745_0070 [Arthrobacter woluwensis]
MAEEVPVAHAFAGGEIDWRKWGRGWEAADLPEGTHQQWQAVMRYRTQLPDDAVVLARHGWTPQDVVAARTDWFGRFPEMLRGGVKELYRTEEEAVAWALLADETAKYHESQRRLVLGERAQFISDLAERLPAGRRWSQARVAELLGLKKQRVQAILKRKSLD